MESPADPMASRQCWPRFPHLPWGFAPAWAALAAIAAQAVGLAGPFQYDDWRVIVGDPAVHSLAAWWADQPGLRPLLKLSYALNWAVDAGPVGFHLVNLLIHAAGAAIVAQLAGSCRYAESAGRLGLITGLMFALHPLQTEAVTYICGRSASLSTLLLLAALLAHVRRRWWLELALFAAVVAVKETAVIYPLLLLTWDRWAAVDPPPLRRGLAAITLALLGLAVLAAIPVYGQLATFSTELRPLADTMRGQISGLAYLGQRVVLPIGLGIDPDLPSPRDWTMRLAGQALLIVGVAGAAWIAGRRRPWWRLALVWAMAALLPTYSVIPRIDLVAERHAYLAGLGIWLALAAEVTRVRRPLRITGLASVVLAGLTILRCLDFRSEVALWRSASVQSPQKARVWNNLGFAYALEGRSDDAAKAFRRALSIDPDFIKARNNLDALSQP
jgi:tetratricopeptide (TPR) repeat protein